jgi:plastocyanin
MDIDGNVRRFRDRHPERPVRITVMAAMMAMVLAFLGVGMLLTSAQSKSTTSTTAAGAKSTPTIDTLEIGEYDILFTPNLATIPADTPVQVKITNNSPTMHNFSITGRRNSGLQDLDVSIDTDPGQTSMVTIDAPAGHYYFYCDELGHERLGMFGYLTVKNGASITTSKATVTPRAG